MNGVARGWLGLLAALLPLASPLAAEAPHRDERSLERFAWECRNDIGRREITLFANGTLRLRSGPWTAMGLELAELSSADLASTLSRLDLVRRSPSFPDADGIRPWAGDLGGPYSQRCRIHLDLPTQEEPIDLEFSIYDAAPHALARLKVIADDLARRTRGLDGPERFPSDFQPRPDDVLRTADGVLYRVIGVTSDGRGIELERLDQPIRVYHALEALPDLFVAVEGHGIDPLQDDLQLEDLEVREPSAGGGGEPGS